MVSLPCPALRPHKNMNYDLAKMWCELNIFEWPDQLPFKEPPRFQTLSHDEKRKLPEYRILWELLSKAVPQKEKSRAWHTKGFLKPPKTNEEFEKWWESDQNLFR